MKLTPCSPLYPIFANYQAWLSVQPLSDHTCRTFLTPIALIAAVETGEIEKLNTIDNRFNFPHSGVPDDSEDLQKELDRKDKIIDYLLKLLDRYSSEVQVKEVGDVKIVPIDYAIRAASAY